MAGSRRSLAIALIAAVLIGCSCAAPASEENDINYGLVENERDPVTILPAFKLNSKMFGSTTENVGDSYDSDDMEEPESSNPGPQYSTSPTTRVAQQTSTRPKHAPTTATITSAPQQSSTTENQLDSSVEDTHSSTTEHPHNAIGRIFSPHPDKPGRIAFAGGVHQYRVRHDEDENKRALEEYNYHFVRKEQGLPPTTKRGDRLRAP